MAGSRQVLRRAAELHDHSGLGNKFADIRPDHVHPKNAIRLCIRQHLDEAIGLPGGAGAPQDGGEHA